MIPLARNLYKKPSEFPIMCEGMMEKLVPVLFTIFSSIN